MMELKTYAKTCVNGEVTHLFSLTLKLPVKSEHHVPKVTHIIAPL
jgi:hypothetical protein